MIETAIEKNIPVLGVCRGMQLINIYFGGSLFQELESQKFQKHDFDLHGDTLVAPSYIKKNLHHKVNLEKDGQLFKCYQQGNIWVNSFHHQGISTLGKGLIVEGRSDDGLVEAISHGGHNILAVQWHPEANLQIPNFAKLFDTWLAGL
jgi:putative glutamine amidotransferase